MLRRDRLQLKILSFAMAAILLSGCAHRAPTNTTETSFQDLKTEPSANVVTNGKEEVKTPEEPFYNSEEVILTPPELDDTAGKKIRRSYCLNPTFVGDRIMTEVTIEYEDENSDTDEWTQPTSYWAIFDLDGRYVGRIQNDDLEHDPKFALDPQGNIVAAFYKTGINDGATFEVEGLYLQRFDRSGAAISEETCFYEINSDSVMLTDLAVTEELGTVVTSTHLLFQLDTNDQVLFREDIGDNRYFMGFLEENGQCYIQILSPDFELVSKENLSLEAVSVGDDGILQHKMVDKDADNLLGMIVYPTQTGVYGATRNALGKIDIANGTFSTLLDWNQTDIDRSCISESKIKVLSEGKLSQPLTILPENGVVTEPFRVPTDESPEFLEESALEAVKTDAEAGAEGSSVPAPDVKDQETSSAMETTVSAPDPSSDPELSGDEKTKILIASEVYVSDGVKIHLIKIEPADENPHAGQDVVWVGGVGITDTSLMKSIVSFNKYSSKGIWVKVYDYTDFRYATDTNRLHKEKSLDNMIAQINSGDGPDIIISSGDSAELDNNRTLTNLNAYLDGPSGIKREEYFDSAFRAFETDGKLFQIPLGFRAYAMLGNSTLAEGRTEMNYVDYSKLRMSMDEDLDLISGVPSSMIVNMYIEGETSSWIDYSNDKVNIRKDSLIEMFEHLKNVTDTDEYEFTESETVGFSIIDDPYAFAWVTDIYTRNAAFCPGSMNSLSEFSYKEILPGESAWYGYPGSTGCTPVISSPQTAGIASYSTQKDKAWEVIKYILSEDVQYSMNIDRARTPGPYYFYDIIPVNVAAFRQLNKETSGKSVGLRMIDPAIADVEFPESEKDRLLEEYEALLQKPLRRYIRDERVILAVHHYLNAYLNDEMSVEEAADSVERELKSIFEE